MTALTPEFLDLQAALAGEYSLEREIGRGGMGVVYHARDVQLDRLVAIKVLPAHLTVAPGARERFLREARTAAGLSHPNIVPIHRVGEAGGFVYFVRRNFTLLKSPFRRATERLSHAPSNTSGQNEPERQTPTPRLACANAIHLCRQAMLRGVTPN